MGLFYPKRRLLVFVLVKRKVEMTLPLLESSLEGTHPCERVRLNRD